MVCRCRCVGASMAYLLLLLRELGLVGVDVVGLLRGLLQPPALLVLRVCLLEPYNGTLVYLTN